MTTIDPDLAAALTAAMTELTNPTKDSKAEAGQYAYTYAGLDAVLAHVRPTLAAHGLAIVQDVTQDEGRVVVDTTIVHASGSTLTFGPLMGPMGNSYQQLGSGITYLRRYAILAALGIAAEDDDGHGAATSNGTESYSPREQLPTAPVDTGARRGPARRDWMTTPATDDQRRLIGRLVREAGFESSQAFLASDECRAMLGGEPSSPLVKGHASTLIDGLQAYLSTRDEVAAELAVDPETGEVMS